VHTETTFNRAVMTRAFSLEAHKNLSDADHTIVVLNTAVPPRLGAQHVELSFAF